jgi:hypothetical protein
MLTPRMLAVAAIALTFAAGSAFAAVCCGHNPHGHETLHGTIVHQDVQSAGAAHTGAGHCRNHGCGHAAGHTCGNHGDQPCQHDLSHNSYCAKNCSAHHATCQAPCSTEHAKDCGDHVGRQGCQRHACGRDCDQATQKCAHCGHSHCGDHAWNCHTTHHHVVASHSCQHEGCNTHCHTDGLRPELRSKVEEVRMHHLSR